MVFLSVLVASWLVGIWDDRQSYNHLLTPISLTLRRESSGILVSQGFRKKQTTASCCDLNLLVTRSFFKLFIFPLRPEGKHTQSHELPILERHLSEHLKFQRTVPHDSFEKWEEMLSRWLTKPLVKDVWLVALTHANNVCRIFFKRKIFQESVAVALYIPLHPALPLFSKMHERNAATTALFPTRGTSIFWPNKRRSTKFMRCVDFPVFHHGVWQLDPSRKHPTNDGNWIHMAGDPTRNKLSI